MNRVISPPIIIALLACDVIFACPDLNHHDNNALAQPTLFSQPKDLDESFARVVAAHLGFIIKRPLEGAPLAEVQNILEYIQLILPGQLTVYKKTRLSITVRGSAEAGEILVYFPGGYILRYLNPEMHDSILPLSGTIFCTGYPIGVNKYLCVQLVKPDASSQQAVMRLELLRGNVHDLNNCITGFGGVDGNPITEAAAAGSPSDAGREIRTKGIFAALFARFKEEQERLSSEEPLSSAIRNRVIQTTLKTPGLKRASVRALRTLGYRPVLRSLIFSVPFAKRSTMWLQSKFIVPTLEDLDSASQKCAEVISDKAKENIDVIFDSVGDASTSLEEAASHVERYMNMMDRLKSGTGRRIEYSIKLSAIVYEPWPKMAGEIDESKRERVKDVLKKLLIEAKERDAIIRIDAEEYAYWRYTLGIYREVIDELADEDRNLVICDDRNTLRMGIVVQAYLKDAGKTLSDLMEWAGKKGYRVPIRLVKGAYDSSEKEWAASGYGPDEMKLNGGDPYPSPVFAHKESTDANYELLTGYLLSRNDRFHTAIASHNVRSIANAMSLMDEYGLAKEDVEFQMLYGMGEPLQLTIRSLGYPMRVYIPVGSFIAGMKYSGRRLEELGNKDNALTRTMAGDYEFLENLGATAPRFQGGDGPTFFPLVLNGTGTQTISEIAEDWQHEKADDGAAQKLIAKSRRYEEYMYEWGKGVHRYTEISGEEKEYRYLLTRNISIQDLPPGYPVVLREPDLVKTMPGTVKVKLPPSDIFLTCQNNSGSDGVVRLGWLDDGMPVAMKTYYTDSRRADNDRIYAECEDVLFADRIGIGPRLHGLFYDKSGRINMVMDVVPGDSLETMKKFITLDTIRDLAEINKRLISNGKSMSLPDIQYLITPEGRILFIDIEGINFTNSHDSSSRYVEQLVRLLADANEDVRIRALTDIAREDPGLFDKLGKKVDDASAVPAVDMTRNRPTRLTAFKANIIEVRLYTASRPANAAPATPDDAGAERVKIIPPLVQKLIDSAVPFDEYGEMDNWGPGTCRYVESGDRIEHGYIVTSDISTENLPPDYPVGLREPELEKNRPGHINVNLLPEMGIFLASSQDRGTDGVVRFGWLDDGTPVAIKAYYTDSREGDNNKIHRDYEEAFIDDRLGIMPRVHGLFKDSSGRDNIVMDVMPGDFPDVMKEYITTDTFRDLTVINDRIAAYRKSKDLPIRHYPDMRPAGYPRAQYFITRKGRIQLIDVGGIGIANPLGSDFRYVEEMLWLLVDAAESVRTQVLHDIARDNSGLLGALENQVDSIAASFAGSVTRRAPGSLVAIKKNITNVKVGMTSRPANAAPVSGELEIAGGDRGKGNIAEGFNTIMVYATLRNEPFTREDFLKKRGFSYTTITTELEGMVTLGILIPDKSRKQFSYKLSQPYCRAGPEMLAQIRPILEGLPARPSDEQLKAAIRPLEQVIAPLRKQILIEKARSIEERSVAYSTGVQNFMQVGGRTNYKHLLTKEIALSDLPADYPVGLREPGLTLAKPYFINVSLPETDIFLASLVYNGRYGVVRLGWLDDGTPVAIKANYADVEEADNEMTIRDVMGLFCFNELGMGPRIHGLFCDSPGRINVVTDIVPGDFLDVMKEFVTIDTFKDILRVYDRITSENMSMFMDDPQYFITPNGSIQFIDGERIKLLGTGGDFDNFWYYYGVLGHFLNAVSDDLRFQALKYMAINKEDLFGRFYMYANIMSLVYPKLPASIAEVRKEMDKELIMSSASKALPVLVNGLTTVANRLKGWTGKANADRTNGLAAKEAEKRRVGIFIDKGLGGKGVDEVREAIADIARNGGPLFENIAIESGEMNTAALGSFQGRKRVADEDLIIISRNVMLECLSTYEGTSMITKVDDGKLPQDSYYPLPEIALFALVRHRSLNFGKKEKEDLTKIFRAIPNIGYPADITTEEILSLFWDDVTGLPKNLVVIKLGMPNARQLTADSQLYKDIRDYIAKHA